MLRRVGHVFSKRLSASLATEASSRASAGARLLDEFLWPSYEPKEEGESARPPAGRAWSVSELRGKSFEDLHGLWFVCLKEKNRLLSERLWYAQEGRFPPDGIRLRKVRKTMARIKVVLGERQRASEALLFARGELGKRQVQEKLDDSVQVALKVGGRHRVVPHDHPLALRPTRAEQRMRRAAIRRHTRWNARLQRRKEQEGEVPAEVKSWIRENLSGADAETAMEAAAIETDVRFAEEEGDLLKPLAGRKQSDEDDTERS